MNADQIEILGTLRSQVKAIMSALEKEKNRNEKLESENQNLKAKYDQQAKEFEELEHKYNNLKLAKAMLDGGDGHDARIKVNRIVREIDKCIALLNR